MRAVLISKALVQQGSVAIIYLFITPEGSITQHHHYKDSRKAQETKN